MHHQNICQRFSQRLLQAAKISSAMGRDLKAKADGASRMLALFGGLAIPISFLFAAPTASGQTVLHVDCDRLNGPGSADDDPGLYDGLSWETAYGHVDDALAEARLLYDFDGTQTQIWIAEGMYVPGGGYKPNDGPFVAGDQSTANTFSPVPETDLFGGFNGTETELSQQRPFAHTTTLSGDLAGNGPTGSRCRVFHFPSTDGVSGSATILIWGLTIEGGGTAGRGGGVLIEGPAHVGPSGSKRATFWFQDVTIRDCRTLSSGGGIAYIPPGNGTSTNSVPYELWVVNSTIDGCLAEDDGGAVYHLQHNRTRSKFLNSTFSNNIAGTDGIGSGGAVFNYADGASANPSRWPIIGCRFLGNSAANDGGALWADGVTEPIIRSCAFIANEAGGNGGAYWQRNSWFSIAASTFWYNRSLTGNGHSIYQRKARHYNLTNGVGGVMSSLVFVCDDTIGGDNIHFSNDTGYRWGVTADETVFYNGNYQPDSDSTNGATTPVFSSGLFNQFSDIWAEFDFTQTVGPDGVVGTTDDVPSLAEGSMFIDAGRHDKYYDSNGGSINDGEVYEQDDIDIDGDGDTDELYPLDAWGNNRLADVDTVPNTGTGTSSSGEDQSFMDIGGVEVQACQDCEGERYWSNPNGGPFDFSTNWFPGTPGFGNTAVFDLGVDYTVRLDQSATTAGLFVRQGNVLLDLSTSDYSITDYLNPHAPGVPGDDFRGLIVGDSSTASLTIDGGFFTVPVDTAVDIGLRSGSDGTLVLDGASTMFVDEVVRVGPRGEGSLIVRNDSALITTDLRIGDTSSTTALVEVQGPNGFIDAIEGVTLESGILRLTDNSTIFAGIPGFSGVFVKDGSRIEGRGTIVGNIINRGELELISPPGKGGFEPAQLNIMGDYLQFDQVPSPTQSRVFSGKLSSRIGMDGSGEVAADLLNVSGRAVLGGGLILTGSDGLLPVVGGQLPTIITAGEIVSGSSFDVVFAPVLTVDNSGTLTNGTLIPVTSPEGNAGVSLSAITLDDLLFGGGEFASQGTPNDAVLGDITGDGVDDLVIAVPTLAAFPQGAIALLEGDDSNGFTFVSVALYTDAAKVDAPTAVEIGNFDSNGPLEIAFASGGNGGVSNDVHFIRFNGVGLVDSPLPAFNVDSGSVIVDLAVDDGFFASPGSDLAILEHTTGPGSEVNMVRLNIGGNDWDFCVLPVDGDDPDAVDPIDTDGSLASLYTPGIAVTTRSDNRLWVFTPQSSDLTPDDWARLDFPTGVGPRDVRAADLDGDMIDDLVVINQTAGSLTVLRTRGGGDIAPPVDIPASVDPVSLALVDLDDDGDRDIAIVANNQTQRVVRQLRNTTTSPGSITITGAEDIPDQTMNVTPVLIRSSDLDNSNLSGIEDDLVILVQPGGARGTEGSPMHSVRLSKKCPADVNGDGTVSPADFTAWIAAFNLNAPECDQNNDGVCTPADFTAWIANYNVGC